MIESIKNKYMLVACNRSFPNLRSILTNGSYYREIYDKKEDMIKALKSSFYDDYGVGCYYITSTGDICNSDKFILYRKYKNHYIERTYCSSNNIYDNKGNYIGVHYHKLFVFNEDYIGREGFKFIKGKAYPIYEYAEFTNKKPEILHTKKVKSILVQDLEGYNIMLDGFLGVNDFDYGAGVIGSTFNPNTKNGYIVNTLTYPL